jgi:hypothetical protein
MNRFLNGNYSFRDSVIARLVRDIESFSRRKKIQIYGIIRIVV